MLKRQIRRSEILLLAGLSFILLFMIFHDWLPLGTFNDIEQVQKENTFQELLTVTIINAGQILLLMGLVLSFIGRRYPIWVRLWLSIHQVSIFAGAVLSWWLPYLFGYRAEERVERFEQMFGDTHSFLPTMNGITPNTLHVLFHLALFVCIILTIYISFTQRKDSYREPDSLEKII